MKKEISISCDKAADKQKIYHMFELLFDNIEPTSFKAKHYLNGKRNRFNNTKFKDAFFNEIRVVDDIRIRVEWDKGSCVVVSYKADLAYRFYVVLEDELHNRVAKELENFIVENAIMAGEAYVHDMAIQNERFIHMLECNGENPDDYPKHKGTTEEIEIDIAKNPGYCVVHRGLSFAAFYRMWFGKGAYELFDKDALRSFLCYENVVLDNDVTRITLYENILDYKKKENRDKQWEFREKLHLDEIASKVKQEEDEERKRTLDPVLDIKQGNFEHGGVRLIRTYLKDGENVKRSEADSYEEAELDEKGNVVYRIIQEL